MLRQFALMTLVTVGVAMTLDDVDMLGQKGELGRSVIFELDREALGEMSASDVAAEVASVTGCTSEEPRRVFRDAGKFEDRHKEYGLDLWWKVFCSGNEEDASDRTMDGIKKLMTEMDKHTNAMLETIDLVETDVPDVLTEDSFMPNDPKLPDQETHWNMINLFDAWQYEKGNEKVSAEIILVETKKFYDFFFYFYFPFYFFLIF